MHELTTLSSTRHFKKYVTCSFRFRTIVVFLKNSKLKITQRILDRESGYKVLFWIRYQARKLAIHVLFQNMLPCILFCRVVLKRFTIGQHERDFELQKNNNLLAFWWILGSNIQKLWSKITFGLLAQSK